MKHVLPKLDYGYDALEPYLDARTLEIHFTKHHQAYADKLNAVLEKYPDLAEQPLPELLGSLDKWQIDEADKAAIRNHGGGHLNHSLYWQIMGPAKEVDQALVQEIEAAFGTLEGFKKQFSDLAAGLFGSGWVWLARDEQGQLRLDALPNQDSPYVHGHTPVICLDVWEHAYYLKYQNRRAEYIQAWWNVLKRLP